MVEKLNEYEGFLGRLHGVRDSFKERTQKWKEDHPNGVLSSVRSWIFNLFSQEQKEVGDVTDEYSHLYKRKTRHELIRVSAAVMGIEFSYAAETAFVSPTLLKIGVEHKHMTLVWALSPLVGFFLTPVLGSVSDRCRLNLGRRRPFIILMSIGVLIGLLLVPNGEYFGYLAGDIPASQNVSFQPVLSHRTTALAQDQNITLIDEENENNLGYHPWGIFFTILGTVLLDFDADACQSPARAYLLDVTVPDDHARGLSTFTIMAGLGGFFGYATGGINWDITIIGSLLGGHVRAVFTLITFIFVICVVYTVTSFKEMPLSLIENINSSSKYTKDESSRVINSTEINYGTLVAKDEDEYEQEENEDRFSSYDTGQRLSMVPPPNASLLLYLKSIIYMPYSLRILCLTNLFCWMAHVCYSLYFTDFVGEAVFNGNPAGIEGSEERELYEEGIRFGCWGMSMYSLSCACYSVIIEKLIKRFRARNVYVGGLLFYSSGMLLMAITKHKVGVIVFSWTAGVMYSTLFTMPYLLVAHYHANNTFEQDRDDIAKNDQQVRGLGTDVALVSSMVFLAQFILSMGMGSIVSSTGTTTSVVTVASLLAFFGAMSASQVMYLDL
ncbi:hypothetical protein RN001_004550 [Aquatica leii]|uniref:Proton-associated sugar transporter A n=1 Tax=Aquatica leii TaxID=1421715 RepID=A0AAN7PEN4_9COLE|nr:hypothetical protein RN001_004550 [Aquatica leii]